MKSQQEIHDDLTSIRTIMEKSSKFISLSGLSGILAGVYALLGAAAALYLTTTMAIPTDGYKNDYHVIGKAVDLLWPLFLIAALVLAASLITGFVLSGRKAKKHGTAFWTPATYRIIINLSIPLVTGGIVIITQLFYGNYEFVAPGCLLFYGLALLAASPNLSLSRLLRDHTRRYLRTPSRIRFVFLGDRLWYLSHLLWSLDVP